MICQKVNLITNENLWKCNSNDTLQYSLNDEKLIETGILKRKILMFRLFGTYTRRKKNNITKKKEKHEMKHK